MSDSQLDIVVIGAGSAGLAAAKTARAAGLSVRVLEAKDRIGGRACTDEIAPGIHWDRGAYWLHDSAHNFFTGFAREIGFAFDGSPRNFRLWNRSGYAEAVLIAERDAYYDRAFDAIDRAGDAGIDIPASDVLPHHARFRTMFECWYAALSGAEPDLCSTLDQSRYRDGVNLRVRPGYGALVSAYGADLPVALSTPVQRIRYDGPSVSVETAQGPIACRAVIVTVSTTALARGGLKFEPALPPELREAIDCLPLGTAEKIAFAFDRDIFGLPENTHVHPEHSGQDAIRFHIKPGGQSLAVGYVAGRFASELESAGSDAMIDFAQSKLTDIFGNDVARARIAAAATHWASDPHIGGGYSFAVPGAAHMRAILSRPVGERVFFAGEANSITAFGTVHGAHASGVAAAHAAVQTVNSRSRAL